MITALALAMLAYGVDTTTTTTTTVTTKTDNRPDVVKAEDLAGIWDVEMRANASTCTTVQIGEIKSEIWTIGADGANHGVTVNVSGGDNTPAKYTGTYDPKGTGGVGFGYRPHTGVWLHWKGSKELIGLRLRANPVEVAAFNHQACAISYEVKATKHN